MKDLTLIIPAKNEAELLPLILGELNKYKYKIKKIIPVGSLYMENAWFNKKKDLKNVPNSNILILGINTLKNTRHYVNNIYENSYYNLFLDWINQLALDFPNLKIVYNLAML